LKKAGAEQDLGGGGEVQRAADPAPAPSSGEHFPIQVLSLSPEARVIASATPRSNSARRGAVQRDELDRADGGCAVSILKGAKNP